MTRQDELLSRLERLNPVPDPSHLFEDPVAWSHPRAEEMREMVASKRMTQVQDRARRTWLVAAAAAVVVVAALGGALLILTSGTETAGPARLGFVFDGVTCSYDGPTRIEAGEAEIVFTNTMAQGQAWIDVMRLRGEATTEEYLAEYRAEREKALAGEPTSSLRPQMAESVYFSSTAGSGATVTAKATLAPGTHVVGCGTAVPWVWIDARHVAEVEE